jgi:hypothetical protein
MRGMNDTKAVVLRWFLRASALFQLIYWGLSHLLFPGWYLRSIGRSPAELENGLVVLLMGEIGILSIGMAVATWILASDPARHLALLIVLYVVGAGSILVSLCHMAFGRGADGEWTTVVAIFLQLAVVTFLYPWPRRGAQGHH